MVELVHEFDEKSNLPLMFEGDFITKVRFKNVLVHKHESIYSAHAARAG